MTDWRAELVEDISKIHDGVSAQAVLTTIAKYVLEAGDAATRKNLMETRRLVQHAIAERLLPAIKIEEVSTEVESCWRDMCEVFKEYVPAEVWEGEVEQRTVELFSNVREKLR